MRAGPGGDKLLKAFQSGGGRPSETRTGEGVGGKGARVGNDWKRARVFFRPMKGRGGWIPELCVGIGICDGPEITAFGMEGTEARGRGFGTTFGCRGRVPHPHIALSRFVSQRPTYNAPGNMGRQTCDQP